MSDQVNSGKKPRDRGQLVLLAAIALAVAMIPLVLAYMQLGYHDDLESDRGDIEAPQVERSIGIALGNVSDGIVTEYEWDDRDDAIETVRERLDPMLSELNRSGLDRGTVIQITYNETRAAQWASTNCPSGSDREFGDCEALDGVVVQERRGETHVLTVGVDIRVTGQEREELHTTVLTG